MSGNKCGFIVRLVEPGPNPVHDVQISTFYQRDKPGLEEMYTVEIRRAPIPEVETKPWKVRILCVLLVNLHTVKKKNKKKGDTPEKLL